MNPNSRNGFQKGHKFFGDKKTLFQKGHIPLIKGKKCPEISKRQMGNKNPSWKGGSYKDNLGYIHIYQPNHPFAIHQRYVLQSHLIAEKCLGRYLTSKEIIHHINGIKNDDCPENLYLFPTPTEHSRYEHLKNKPILKSNLL